jgi:hypothetical protein
MTEPRWVCALVRAGRTDAHAMVAHALARLMRAAPRPDAAPAAQDEKSGRLFYYHEKTRETSWIKSPSYIEFVGCVRRRTQGRVG